MRWVLYYLLLVPLTLYLIPFKDNKSAKLVFFLSLLGLSLAEIVHILDSRLDPAAGYVYLLLFFINSVFFYAGLTVRNRREFYLWSLFLSTFNLFLGFICLYISSFYINSF